MRLVTAVVEAVGVLKDMGWGYCLHRTLQLRRVHNSSDPLWLTSLVSGAHPVMGEG